jgi:hypothetical protein
VALDRQTDDPQLIFESLNSTGVDLSQSDLIRNFILMRLPEKEQTHLYDAYWAKIERLFRGSEGVFDTFARDYVALKSRASKQERASEIYYAFREFFPRHCDASAGLEAGLADLLRFARYYAAFSTGTNVEGELARALARVRRLVDVPAMLVTRLFECYEIGTLHEHEFLEALELIESYVMRRAVCGYQTRGYWQVFAALAYKIGDRQPLANLKVALARQRENYRFPSNDEFERALTEKDLYGLRVCRHLLEGLENYGSKEPTDTTRFSIEHILPQIERLSPEWRSMLGEEWETVQKTWLHRLGNLTLTAYNSEYSYKPFSEKKVMPGGFAESSVRLNKFVREQPVWTENEIRTRTIELAHRAIAAWLPLEVPRELIEAAKHAEMRELAGRRDVGNVKMDAEARSLFEKLRPHVLAMDSKILELAESDSISYHAPDFFLEILPRRHRLTLLLDLDFNEVDDPSGIAEDATRWKFRERAARGRRFSWNKR